ncbi:MAG: hypothetical protein LBC33_00455 [Mycoplasmataceae bacterium]|jgi:ABC-type transporter Mla subunit MlaD|nr:hypothetical protein [Mycoplasmataceae bacterium]
MSSKEIAQPTTVEDTQENFTKLVQLETSRASVDNSGEFHTLAERQADLFQILNSAKIALIAKLTEVDTTLNSINTLKREINEVSFAIQQFLKSYQGQVDDVVNRQKEFVNDLDKKEKFHH